MSDERDGPDAGQPTAIEPLEAGQPAAIEPLEAGQPAAVESPEGEQSVITPSRTPSSPGLSAPSPANVLTVNIVMQGTNPEDKLDGPSTPAAA